MGVKKKKKKPDYRKYVQKRLKGLTPVFARSSLGDFSADLNIPSEDDEFTDLYAGVQVMVEVIREKLSDLNRLNRSLEKKVRERTEELRGSHAELEKKVRERTVELEAANEELQRLNRTQSAFTSMVSHELRTPLNSIKEGIAIVMEGLDGPLNEAQSKTLGIANSNVNRLARFINNVLDYTKFQTGRMDIHWAETNMRLLLQEIFQFMEPGIRKREILFELALPPSEIVARCDPDKIKQVVINLIDNAMKFTRTGGRILVRLEADPDRVKISVEDSGIGIRPEDQQEIFEMFTQASDENVWRAGGSGIGLTVCRMIVSEHRGRITVESQEGKGSRFTVAFPILSSSFAPVIPS